MKTIPEEELKNFIRDVPDFPKPGVVFKDITPLLLSAAAFQSTITHLANRFSGRKVDQVVGIEARGFIFAAAVAYRMGVGFIPARKKGKLPWKTERVSYQLEYGEDILEIHQDAIKPGSRILLVDDVLATGGTAQAITNLIQRMGGIVEGVGFVIELAFLDGRSKLPGFPVESLIRY